VDFEPRNVPPDEERFITQAFKGFRRPSLLNVAFDVDGLQRDRARQRCGRSLECRINPDLALRFEPENEHRALHSVSVWRLIDEPVRFVWYRKLTHVDDARSVLFKQTERTARFEVIADGLVALSHQLIRPDPRPCSGT
jgi:hypothetical protein